MPNGQTFIASQSQLIVVDLQGAEVFRVNRPANDILLGEAARNGQFFVITNRGVGLRLDSAGKEIKQFAIGPVQQFVGLDVLPAGKFLVPQTAANKVVEMDADGKVGWSAERAAADLGRPPQQWPHAGGQLSGASKCWNWTRPARR